MKNLKVGVAGVGHMGAYHVNVLRSLPIIETVFIYDKDQEKIAKLLQASDEHPVSNITNTSSFKEFIDSIDACILAVPTTLHYQMGMELLNAGKHLLVEKPIAYEVEEAEELIDTARKNDLVLHVGHVERYNGAVQELKNVIKEPLLWESRRLGNNPGRIVDVGVGLDLLIHDVDIALNIIDDEVDSISAYGKKILSAQNEDILTTNIQFKKGCIASFSASRLTHEKIRTLSISEKDCYIYLNFTTQDLQIHRQSNTSIRAEDGKIRYQQQALVEHLFIHKENPLKQELTYFLTQINTDKLQRNYINDDVKTLKIIKHILTLIQ